MRTIRKEVRSEGQSLGFVDIQQAENEADAIELFGSMSECINKANEQHSNEVRNSYRVRMKKKRELTPQLMLDVINYITLSGTDDEKSALQDAQRAAKRSKTGERELREFLLNIAEEQNLIEED